VGLEETRPAGRTCTCAAYKAIPKPVLWHHTGVPLDHHSAGQNTRHLLNLWKLLPDRDRQEIPRLCEGLLRRQPMHEWSWISTGTTRSPAGHQDGNGMVDESTNWKPSRLALHLVHVCVSSPLATLRWLAGDTTTIGPMDRKTHSKAKRGQAGASEVISRLTSSIVRLRRVVPRRKRCTEPSEEGTVWGFGLHQTLI